MPPCFWPWAIKHSCYITNRLSCLTTKSVPLIDFMKGLKQPYEDKIDFTLLPRFDCRAYKYIGPKPGKFEARAELGWFLGFQKNTNKNFPAYYPHHTASSGWKWVETFSPHVTFNEEIMFGSMLNSIDKQKTNSYWANFNAIPGEKITNREPHNDFQPSQCKEGGKAAAPNVPNNPLVNKNSSVSLPISKESISAPPAPEIPNNIWPQRSKEPSKASNEESLIIKPVTIDLAPPPSSINGSECDSQYESEDSSATQSENNNNLTDEEKRKSSDRRSSISDSELLELIMQVIFVNITM